MMTIVLVHGNPETEAIWDDLVPHLRDHHVVRLSPPGLGSAIPPGFDCSIDAYRDWLEGELKKLAQPVDLVGHDWGGGHVVRIAMDCPGLVRSWTSDILGAFDADYVWHDLAQTWQTPEVGEQAVAQTAAMPTEPRAQRYESLGMTLAIAQNVAAGANKDIGRAILALYRSAAQPVMRDLGSSLPRAAAKPGLALIATEDHYCGGETLARFCAKRAGAKVAVLKGGGSLVDVRAAKTRCRRDKHVSSAAKLGKLPLGSGTSRDGGCPFPVLVVCKRIGRHAALVANHCRRLMFSRRSVQ